MPGNTPLAASILEVTSCGMDRPAGDAMCGMAIPAMCMCMGDAYACGYGAYPKGVGNIPDPCAAAYMRAFGSYPTPGIPMVAPMYGILMLG